MKVRFSHIVIVHILPYEDRTSPWMRMAIDRLRFRRRIEQTGRLIEHVLIKNK